MCAGLQQALQDSLASASKSGAAAARQASFPILSTSLHAAHDATCSGTEQSMGQPRGLLLPLRSPLAAQQAAGFCLGILQHAWQLGPAPGTLQQPPVSSALGWLGVHGGLSLRTRALQAVASAARQLQSSFSSQPQPWPTSLPAVAAFLAAQQSMPIAVQPDQEQLAAWWAAWARLLAVAAERPPHGAQRSGATEAQAAVSRILQLLEACAATGQLSAPALDEAAASVTQLVAAWQGPWPQAARMVSLAGLQPSFLGAGVAAVRSLAPEVGPGA